MLSLPKRMRDVLEHHGCVSDSDILKLTRRDMSIVPGCGRNTIKDIEALQDKIRRGVS